MDRNKYATREENEENWCNEEDKTADHKAEFVCVEICAETEERVVMISRQCLSVAFLMKCFNVVDNNLK
ncbi:hypothetical protein DICVIV_10109 [Dictyocaulus viviparus]|uniref:Uncharacterized protein n=1 Tax=Dictyocaulus viviparus TaxID=29172 RepID=A0A0D8XJD4_DICVI|nr:hypothetical protein DICVIV_10109 [Dictyocaulus viviparus]